MFKSKLSTLNLVSVKAFYSNVNLFQRQLARHATMVKPSFYSSLPPLTTTTTSGSTTSITPFSFSPILIQNILTLRLHFPAISIISQITCKRFYAKRNMVGRKDSGKKSGKDALKVNLNEEEIHDIIDLNKMKGQMDTTLSYLKKELTDQLALRLSLSTVANISVDTAEGKVPLSQIAQVQQKTPQMIIVNMSENPEHTNAVKIAILNSGINVTPQVEGVTLYLPIQKVTREHREKLAKNAKAICDKCKDKLRNIQNNYERELKAQKAKQIHSQDLLMNIHETILATTKEYYTNVDEILEAKQVDLLKT